MPGSGSRRTPLSHGSENIQPICLFPAPALAHHNTIAGSFQDTKCLCVCVCLLYSAFEADAERHFVCLRLTLTLSSHTSSSIFIFSEDGEWRQITIGLRRTRACRDFSIMRSKGSDPDTKMSVISPCKLSWAVKRAFSRTGFQILSCFYN